MNLWFENIKRRVRGVWMTPAIRKQLVAGAVGAGIVFILALPALWKCEWFRNVVAWFAWWLIPAIILFVVGIMDHQEKMTVTHHDFWGQIKGYSRIPTGRIISGSLGMGKLLAGAWLVLYLAYSVLYGWWH